MSKFLRHEQCPRCAAKGADRRGNNLGVYSDGSCYCYSCGYRRPPEWKLNFLIPKEKVNDNEKAVLPSDFSTEVPSSAWRWLLQYGLPYTYWQAHCGYSEKEGRLIFRVGHPSTRFSIGRYVGTEPLGKSKWKVYGDKSSYVEVVGEQLSDQVVLVEDIISAHKVAATGLYLALPLFGTTIGDNVVKKLQELAKPVSLWLDNDQYTHLPKKMGRLQGLLDTSVRHISTRRDPKEYSLEEIKEILK